jgi:hypothetical protein
VLNIYFDNLSVMEAKELFDAFAENSYLSNAECNLNGHNSSVRLEGYDRYTFLSDLADHFYVSR